MRRLLGAVWAAPLAAILAAPLPAQAVQWVKVGAGGGSESYIDKASMIKIDKTHKVWSLDSFADDQATADGTPYRSLKALKLYACAERTTTLQMRVYYAEPMGKGAIVQSLKYEKFSPEDVIPDSAEDAALQQICHPSKKK